MYLLLEEMNKSIVDFKRAVELNPNHPIAYAQKLYTDYRKANKQNAVVIILSKFEIPEQFCVDLKKRIEELK